MANWRKELLATLSVPQEQREAERQNQIRSAEQVLRVARNGKQWHAHIRNQAIGKAWDAGATRRELADASGIVFAKISQIVNDYVFARFCQRDRDESFCKQPVMAVIDTYSSITLMENGIVTVSDLIDCARERLISFPGIGRKKADKIMRYLARAVAVEEQGGEKGYAKWVEANAERFVLHWYWDDLQYFPTKEAALASFNPADGRRLLGAEFGLHYVHIEKLGPRAE